VTHSDLSRQPWVLSMAVGNSSSLTIFLATDTHYWPVSTARSSWVAASDAALERDGLLVSHSDRVLSRLLSDIAAFSESGGDAAIHLGDAVCGGGGFDQPADAYAASLRSLRSLEDLSMPAQWPIHHVPGNHDLSPAGGLTTWLGALQRPCAEGSSTRPIEASAACEESVDSSQGPNGEDDGAEDWLPMVDAASAIAYRSLFVSHPTWRLLLLDSTDGIDKDRDGHGHIGPRQLRWIEAELEAAHGRGQKVVLCMHQLLVDPTDASLARDGARSRRKRGGSTARAGALEPSFEEASGPSWIGSGDMIDNRGEVLEVIARYPGVVRLSLHGHVHANTLVRAHGVAFVTLSSTTEYPMQWHELQLDACEARLLQRPLELPDERRLSERRDTRPGRNRIKLGLASASAMGGRVVVSTCP